MTKVGWFFFGHWGLVIQWSFWFGHWVIPPSNWADAWHADMIRRGGRIHAQEWRNWQTRWS
jgi:hypothetical protein